MIHIGGNEKWVIQDDWQRSCVSMFWKYFTAWTKKRAGPTRSVSNVSMKIRTDHKQKTLLVRKTKRVKSSSVWMPSHLQTMLDKETKDCVLSDSDISTTLTESMIDNNNQTAECSGFKITNKEGKKQGDAITSSWPKVNTLPALEKKGQKCCKIHVYFFCTCFVINNHL